RVRDVRVSERGGNERLRQLVALANDRRIPVRHVTVGVLDRAARNGVHQGVVADVEDAKDSTIDELVSGGGAPLLVVLDGIADPPSLGALLRTIDAAGANGVVIQSRRSAALHGAAAKTSAGALAHVKIAEVVNIARAIEELKQAGVWTVGLAAEANTSYD